MQGDWVSMTEEQRRFESMYIQLGVPNHTTYAGPKPTYQLFPQILQNMNWYAPPESTVPHCPTLHLR
jgi:hypothetical protein